VSAPPAPAHADDAAAAEVVVARQPILDRDEEILGYELLFSAASGRAVAAHAHDAAARVLVLSIADVGLEHLAGTRPAHVKVTRELLVGVRPLPLSPERVVLELPADLEPDEALVEALAELREAGFTLALDGFRTGAAWHALSEHAHMVKIDIRELAGAALLSAVQWLRPRGLTLIARGVDERRDYDVCRTLGFAGFQGLFFAQPALVQGRSGPTHRLGTLSTLVAPESRIGFDQLERMISQDAGLSHKLVRLANSAFVGVRTEVSSVRKALMLLGTVAVRRWTMLLVLAGLNDRPHHLLGVGLLRARLCELLAPAAGAEPERAFTVGLFSVVDALLATPMAELLEDLPFDARTTDALLRHDGPEGTLLASVLAYESGHFEASARSGVSLAEFGRAYRDALAWTEETAPHLT
jgi:EAL and modified HD-GYP domain-containing signal transduction protein